MAPKRKHKHKHKKGGSSEIVMHSGSSGSDSDEAQEQASRKEDEHSEGAETAAPNDFDVEDEMEEGEVGGDEEEDDRETVVVEEHEEDEEVAVPSKPRTSPGPQHEDKGGKHGEASEQHQDTGGGPEGGVSKPEQSSADETGSKKPKILTFDTTFDITAYPRRAEQVAEDSNKMEEGRIILTNEEGATRAMAMGERAMIARDFAKAKRLFERSKRMFPLLGIDTLIEQSMKALDRDGTSSEGCMEEEIVEQQPPPKAAKRVSQAAPKGQKGLRVEIPAPDDEERQSPRRKTRRTATVSPASKPAKAESKPTRAPDQAAKGTEQDKKLWKKLLRLQIYMNL